VVARVFAAGRATLGSPLVGVVMSLGAGFYEELAFRVVLFGLGGKLLVWLFARDEVRVVGPSRVGLRGSLLLAGWALACALVFSGAHYVGPLGDAFDPTSFVFRAVLGLTLTLIYATRGFAAAVWTHAVYDIWVLVFPSVG
jgi:hypothetical protein